MSKPLLLIAADFQCWPIALGHLPYWQDCGCDLVMSWSDLVPPMFRDKCESFIIGPSCHHGPNSIARMCNQWRAARDRAVQGGNDSVVFGEYDTVLLRTPPVAPPDGELWGPLHKSYETHRFFGEHYIHPVIHVGLSTLQRLCDNMPFVPFDANEGFGDRWIAVLCDKADVKMVNDPGTYSQNSLDHPDFLARACECISLGGWGIHGVKHPSMLNALLAARQSG